MGEDYKPMAMEEFIVTSYDTDRPIHVQEFFAILKEAYSPYLIGSSTNEINRYHTPSKNPLIKTVDFSYFIFKGFRDFDEFIMESDLVTKREIDFKEGIHLVTKDISSKIRIGVTGWNHAELKKFCKELGQLYKPLNLLVLEPSH